MKKYAALLLFLFGSIFQAGIASAAGPSCTLPDCGTNKFTGLTLRGNANGMRATVQGYTGGASGSSIVSRSLHITKTEICSASAVLPMFYQPAVPYQDIELQTAYNVQVGIEYPYTFASTGIPPRTPLKFNGALTGSWSPNGKIGYVRSDQTTLPVCIPAGSYYGLWTTVETQSGTGITGGALPWTHQLTNANQRYVGTNITSGTTQLGTSQATSYAFSSTTIPQAGTSYSGGSPAYVPAMLITPYRANEKAVAIDGDSIAYGINEGTGTVTTAGDITGSPVSSSGGFVARGITDKLDTNVAVNTAKPSDGVKHKTQLGAVRYRSQMWQLSNATNLVAEDIQNDQSTTTNTNIVNPVAWASGTYVDRFTVRTANSNVYIATKGGTTSATAPSHTSGIAADNTVNWLYFGPNSGGYTLGAVIYGRQAQMNSIYRQALPGVKITKTFGTPFSQSTDSWATPGGQTAVNPPPTSTESVIKQYYRTFPTDTFLGADAFWDINVGNENGYTGTQASETSIWATTGVANDVTIDGIHPTSKGHQNLGNTATPGILP